MWAGILTKAIGMFDAYIAAIGAALGDPTRVRIIRLLESGSALTVGDLADELDLARGSVHHHLRVMQRAGVVRVESRGRCRFPTLCVGPWEGLLRRPGHPLYP